MNTANDYINSGILEMYALGLTSPEETIEVNEMALKFPEIEMEIKTILHTLNFQLTNTTIKPDETGKPFLISIIDYTERLKAGEIPANPSLLNETSTIIDFQEWLQRKDMVLPDEFDEEYFVKIIGYHPEAVTAIAWLKTGAPEETHTKESERFLILEGTCDVYHDGKITSLKEGSFLEMKLFEKHHITVTSDIPCKMILQRVAA